MADSRPAPYFNLRRIGIDLPKPPKPIANFVGAVESGGLVFVSGQGPRGSDGHAHRGKVGAGVTAEEAYKHARLVGVNLLAVLDEALGSLTRIRRVVKVLGFVNASPEFGDHPKVINGCSDLLVEVFGPEVGHHARSAIGASSLPSQITVEIELIVAVDA